MRAAVFLLLSHTRCPDPRGPVLTATAQRSGVAQSAGQGAARRCSGEGAAVSVGGLSVPSWAISAAASDPRLPGLSSSTTPSTARSHLSPLRHCPCQPWQRLPCAPSGHGPSRPLHGWFGKAAPRGRDLAFSLHPARSPEKPSGGSHQPERRPPGDRRTVLIWVGVPERGRCTQS